MCNLCNRVKPSRHPLRNYLWRRMQAFCHPGPGWTDQLWRVPDNDQPTKTSRTSQTHDGRPDRTSAAETGDDLDWQTKWRCLLLFHIWRWSPLSLAGSTGHTVSDNDARNQSGTVLDQQWCQHICQQWCQLLCQQWCQHICQWWCQLLCQWWCQWFFIRQRRCDQLKPMEHWETSHSNLDCQTIPRVPQSINILYFCKRSTWSTLPDESVILWGGWSREACVRIETHIWRQGSWKQSILQVCVFARASTWKENICSYIPENICFSEGGSAWLTFQQIKHKENPWIYFTDKLYVL